MSVGSLMVMVFVYATAVMGLLFQEMNQRFSDLVELLGEDDLLRRSK